MIGQKTLEYSHSIGLYALRGRGFNNPVDLAFGRDEVMYVLNRAGPEVAVRMPYKRITMCRTDEEYLGEFSSGGKEDGQMIWPASIAIDGDGNVYVSDESLHRISIFDWQGKFVKKWGVKGSGDGRFDRPAGITFDGRGNLLVVDGLNCRIQRYTRDGVFLDGWGGPGSEDGQFNVPWGITVDSHLNVFVADWRNDRVQKFDADGKHLATFGSPGPGEEKFRRPAGVAVDESGRVYVADWGNEKVKVFDEDRGLLAELRGESGLSKWSDDYFHANQEELAERKKADMDLALESTQSTPRQQSASVEKLLWGPTSIKFDSDGNVYVVESCRFRIQVYRWSRD
ncbi:MAG: NHL repeat-containing protein [Chloroflexi bacterium]|nr:NHL repeat-containing protein [Chloroflexota bacterium]